MHQLLAQVSILRDSEVRHLTWWIWWWQDVKPVYNLTQKLSFWCTLHRWPYLRLNKLKNSLRKDNKVVRLIDSAHNSMSLKPIKSFCEYGLSAVWTTSFTLCCISTFVVLIYSLLCLVYIALVIWRTLPTVNEMNEKLDIYYVISFNSITAHINLIVCFMCCI